MRTNLAAVLLLTLLVALGTVGCDREPVTGPSPVSQLESANSPTAIDTDALALMLARNAGWPIEASRAAGLEEGAAKAVGSVSVVDQRPLTGELVHTIFEVRLGDGPYDLIRLHRIVRESSAGRPARAGESIFMLHGSGVGFEGSFLAAPSDPVERSLPVFLAQKNVDVWGIDLGWTQIPLGESDFSFAQDWGLQRDVDDLAAGIAIARATRIVTGNGPARMSLLSWSAGVTKSYIYAAQQTHLPRPLQDVKTLIPVDSPFLSTDPAVVQGSCENIDAIGAARDAGLYVDDIGVLAITAAQLAQLDPNGSSPIPGFGAFTNLQALLLAQTQTGFVLGGSVPTFHLFAGTFDSFGLPTGYRFVPTSTGVEFYASWAPYEPNLLGLQGAQIECPDASADVDVDFGRVELPVLYVGAGGGYGARGTDIESHLASPDFRSLIVSVDSNPILDVGHVDLFKAEIMRDLLWTPVLDWIAEHSHPGSRRGPRAVAQG